MGDSSSEGVQSADASYRTQPFTYLNWLAFKMRTRFPLPKIVSGPFSWVGQTEGRFRLDPAVEGLNLAVSGADADDLLNRRADATSLDAIDSETDLVLFPRLGSQMEIVESLDPRFVVCWIGANDALGAATSWERLDASQLTSVEDFERRFREIGERFRDLSTRVVFLNVPDVLSIAFVVDRGDLIHFLGTAGGLPPGHRTSLPLMLLLKLGLADPALLQDPDYVLDPIELETISERIEAFNAIIDDVASSLGAPVLDVHGILEAIVENPPSILGIPLGRRLTRGMFSLDGVHPSSLTHAILADQTIALMNRHYATGIPRLSNLELLSVFLYEPHLDKDGDLRVAGRPLAGLLETLGPILGLSGDGDDLHPGVGARPAPDALSPEAMAETIERAFRLRR
jgi:lysophospholipase L1-like esterase